MRPTVTAPALALILALGCTKATSGGEDGIGVAPPPPQGEVSVELSGVTLGEDCGVGWTPPPPASRPAKRAPPSAVAPSEAQADCAPGQDCGGGHFPPCQQTSIQLALHAKGTSAPTQVRIKKVELLDAKGASLGELTPKPPTRWSDTGTYQAWDQLLAPGEQAAVSYVLSTPGWNAMEGGRYGQTGKTFQVRVTVLVGARDRVVEKKAIQPAIVPPQAPT